jgi:hypothetical protein
MRKRHCPGMTMQWRVVYECGSLLVDVLYAAGAAGVDAGAAATVGHQ